MGLRRGGVRLVADSGGHIVEGLEKAKLILYVRWSDDTLSKGSSYQDAKAWSSAVRLMLICDICAIIFEAGP